MDHKKRPANSSPEMQDAMNNFFLLAHDIKSPVNQITKLLNLAKSANSEAETSKIIEMALNSSETLSKKVHQILNLAIQSQNDEIKIDFSQIFESVKASLRHFEGFNRTKFITSIDDNINFFGNPVKLQSVFQNLIENAIKYRKPANHQNIIIFTIHEARNSIIIKIADNGRGIKKDLLPKIFDKSFKVNHNDNGHGLGLYLVKKNLNEMGAYIDVESREGDGTTFTIELPYSEKVQSAASA
jgi:signal transduction histidine kinase